jgi:peptidoglycan/xylan/chitin deacetylase (PgdA/CDA1 family)
MNRRDALRAVTAFAVGTTAAGCDASSTGPAPHPPVLATSSGPTPVPSSRTAAPSLPDEITHGPRDRMNVALTFHGQGEPAIVGRLLDEIARGGARVTVLAVGSWLATQPALARQILDAGHELGNHTQHHADIKRMSAAQTLAEIDDCAQALRTISGSIGRWFRPSQTRHATATIKAVARKVGYPTCLSYDVDSLDYTDPGAAAVTDTILSAVRPGSIVSLHFGHAGTITAMAPLLRGLHRRGLTPVTMTDLLT